MSQDPIAFMSYVRFDDQHEEGRLTQFRERLSGEIRIQTGDRFDIFQDRNDILWGEQWESRINKSIDAVTFLVPIVTPGFFKSPPCRSELERFLKREKQLRRSDLILPVYYVECPLLSDAIKRKSDPLAQIIATRQYADWRELRFESFTSPSIGKTLAQLAKQIVAAMERKSTTKAASTPKRKVTHSSPRVKTAASALAAGSTSEAASAKADSASGLIAKKDPPTVVVDAMHRGDYPTIAAALAAANPGDRILIRPGLYNEGVIIDKPIEMVGDGSSGEVVIEAHGKRVLDFTAAMGRISNLTLRQTGGGDFACVRIARGRLELEGCDIISLGLMCVSVLAGADPRLRRNRIHDARTSGVFIFDGSLGVFEDNEITGSGYANVEIKGRSNPIFIRNRIHHGKQGGIFIHSNSTGVFEENEIFANNYAGVEVKGKANPVFRRNRITTNHQSGVYIHTDGSGTFEDNDLRNNRSAWAIAAECIPNVKRERNQES